MELKRPTRNEPTDLLTRIINALPVLPEGFDEREVALTNLHNIRSGLARNDLRSGKLANQRIRQCPPARSGAAGRSGGNRGPTRESGPHPQVVDRA